ncbi:MAG: hypothetical protein ACYDD4_13740 [Acidimicrobiales bacterium]
MTIPPHADPLNTASIDLRKSGVQGHADVSVGVHESLSAGAVSAATGRLRPLTFGAAYKVVDLMLETALEAAGLSPANGRRWRIDEKAAHARTSSGHLPPLSDDAPEIWRGLCDLYATWDEVRHSLVHRKAQVDQATGSLTGFDRTGVALVSVSADDQEQFARLSVEAADVVLKQNLSARQRSVLAWRLNRLAGHHGRAPLADAGPPGNPVRVVVNLEPTESGGWYLNAPAVLQRVRQVFQQATAFDAECHAPAGGVERVFLCHLEDLDSPFEFNLDTPPDWLIAIS